MAVAATLKVDLFDADPAIDVPRLLVRLPCTERQILKKRLAFDWSPETRQDRAGLFGVSEATTCRLGLLAIGMLRNGLDLLRAARSANPEA